MKVTNKSLMLRNKCQILASRTRMRVQTTKIFSD